MKRVQQDGQSIRGLVTNHSLHRHTLFGAIAGLAAGIIMTPFLMLAGVIMRTTSQWQEGWRLAL